LNKPITLIAPSLMFAGVRPGCRQNCRQPLIGGDKPSLSYTTDARYGSEVPQVSSPPASSAYPISCGSVARAGMPFVRCYMRSAQISSSSFSVSKAARPKRQSILAGVRVTEPRLNLRLVEHLCQTRRGKLGRHRAAAHEAEERSEVPGGREAGYEETRQARLEVSVQHREAVG
jgi:hypothetical protein